MEKKVRNSNLHFDRKGVAFKKNYAQQGGLALYRSDIQNSNLKNMEIYRVATWTILFLGIGHALFTFKKFKSIQEDALWFFSTALGLITNVFLNYINLTISNNLVSNLTIGENSIQFVFFAFVGSHSPKVKAFVGIEARI